MIRTAVLAAPFWGAVVAKAIQCNFDRSDIIAVCASGRVNG